ncbi:hypothetical protein [Haliscomenobacter sp.]|uniref:hypothetical protein n=1 Tax=Haliscomenobacter sp. TaxID=2717303 RepID=UPI00359435E5
MLRPTIYCMLLLLSSAQFGFSQVKKGFKYLAKSNYSAARTAFTKHAAHPVYAPLAQYGLVKTEFQEKEPELASIYKMAEALYQDAARWEQLKPKARKKLRKKFQFDTLNIKTLRIELEHKALGHYHDSSGILNFEKHLAVFVDTPSVAIFQQREDLRARMVTWHLRSLRKANYALLDALYNRHHDLLAQRGSRYPDYVYSFILDAFVVEHTYRNLSTFVKEQPGHWFSEACWSDQAVEVLRQDSIQLALNFLRTYPYFILDDWIDLHIERLSNGGLLLDSIDYTPTEWAQLAELRLGWDLTKQLRTGKRSPTYDLDLMRYLPLAAPSRRGYDLFRMALASYQRRGVWDKAIQLLQTARKLYPDVTPPDCEKLYSFYTTKNEWFKTAMEIFQRPADGFSTELLPSLSQAGREELAPVFSPDGQSLYLALDNGRTGLDVFICHYDSLNALWSSPQKVDILSTERDDMPYSITRDGREFLLAQGGKLMMSTFGAADWQKPFGMPLTVNEFPWVGRATLSPDGRCLVFEGSANKKQPHELEPPFIHLYRMFKGESRFGWSNPQAITPLMVEGGEERFPCFGPDSNLYFIADRWPTLGQGDVFVSKPLSGNSDAEMLAKTGITVASSNLPPSNYSKWTVPQNLGKEVNTLGDEKHWLSVAPDNSRAFFSTIELSKNDESELYSIALPAICKAEKRKILLLPLGTIGQNFTGFKRREMVLQVKDAGTDQLIAEIKPQGELRFILSLPASVAKIKYQVIESSKNPVALTQWGEYVIGTALLQNLPTPLLQQ